LLDSFEVRVTVLMDARSTGLKLKGWRSVRLLDAAMVLMTKKLRRSLRACRPARANRRQRDPPWHSALLADDRRCHCRNSIPVASEVEGEMLLVDEEVTA